MSRIKTFVFSGLFLIIFLVSPYFAFCEILFQDNFDSHPDWSPLQDRQIDCLSTEGCPTAPEGYVGYRMGAPIYPGHNTLNIDSTQFRGSSGKAFVFWTEVCDSCGWPADGLLDIQLADYSNGFPELYIRFYMKFQPGWQWATGVSPLQKFLHVSNFQGTGYPYDFFGVTDNKPRSGFQFARYNGGAADIAMTTMHSKFGAQSYTALDYLPNCDYTPNPSCFDPTADALWHSYEFYYKINSADGVSDGATKVWIDGQLMHSANNINWVNGVDPNTRKWNYVWLGGNNYNPYAPQATKPEQWYAIDDIIISTQYVGPAPSPADVPIAGFTVANVIPATELSQATDGTGNVTLNFKVLDQASGNAIILSDFEYSVDNGTTWTVPTNGDSSTAFSSNWSNSSYTSGVYSVVNGSAGDWNDATSYNFTITTKNTDFSALNSFDGNVKFRFFVNNANPTSSYSPVTTEPFALDNLAPGCPKIIDFDGTPLECNPNP